MRKAALLLTLFTSSIIFAQNNQQCYTRSELEMICKEYGFYFGGNILIDYLAERAEVPVKQNLAEYYRLYGSIGKSNTKLVKVDKNTVECRMHYVLPESNFYSVVDFDVEARTDFVFIIGRTNSNKCFTALYWSITEVKSNKPR